MKMIISSVVFLFWAVSNVLCNTTSDCSKKDVISAYIDTAITSISKAKHMIPTTDCSSYCNSTSNCSQAEVITAHLDIAVDVISKVKYINLTGNECPKYQKPKAVDCADVFQMGLDRSGVYEIWPNSRVNEGKSLVVYCDMDTNGGGWTVIQRRGDFGSPIDYFYKDWESYKVGFGKIEEDFWLGNDNIYALTNQKLYSARFDLKDMDQNRRYALYDKFWIDDENNKYTLHISNYSGDAGDSMNYHNNRTFTTRDRDKNNCASVFKGGWWYENCFNANLNGLYYEKKSSANNGITWIRWKNYESLAWSEIKIRPKYFKMYSK